MGLPSSLRHAICVRGLPLALQIRVTSIPSFAKVSELLSSSMISGGTVNKKQFSQKFAAKIHLQFDDFFLKLRFGVVLTDNVEASPDGYNGVGVKLANVLAGVRLLNVPQMEVVSVSIVMLQ